MHECLVNKVQNDQNSTKSNYLNISKEKQIHSYNQLVLNSFNICPFSSRLILSTVHNTRNTEIAINRLDDFLSL